MQRKYRFALPDVHRAASEVGTDDGVESGDVVTLLHDIHASREVRRKELKDR
jgi:hypothetical protein